MLAQICQFLAVDSSNFPQNEHIIISDKSSDGVFLLHYFLNLCQKQKRPLCFVGLSQSFNHFNTVAQKLGANLLSARDENKNLIFIDGLKLLGECVSPHSAEFSATNPFFHLLKGDCTPFLELISTSLYELSKIESHNAPVLIIDDLTFLLSVGVAPQKVIFLVSQLHNLVTTKPLEGSIITLSKADVDDEETNEVWTVLSHLSTLRIELSALETGYCKDVHGQMVVHWSDSLLKPRLPVIKNTQFKVSDKSVDLFASGMSAAVL